VHSIIALIVHCSRNAERENCCNNSRRVATSAACDRRTPQTWRRSLSSPSHLAVHGFADTQYPERSALVLGKDSSDDGLLQVREIIRLKLNAQLATLSACDTGVGKLQGEEGISNLAEAFLVAGARSVVASLWSADDTSASSLMEQFYKRLADGESVSAALRNAKLDMLSKFGNDLNPYYWAAFISVGETSTPIGIQK
jgi:CHAT domain-containing protein